jgi:hypothetical protein
MKTFICAFCGFLTVLPVASASVTLRVVAVNPSENIAQKIPVKVYLPIEVKPEHILFKDDLEVGYDTQQASYYVFGDYDLGPKQTLEKQVELQDIWVTAPAEIAALRQEAAEVLARFAATKYRERADALSREIERKLSEIETAQSQSAVNPEQHISEYRYSVKLVKEIRADLTAVKMLLSDIPSGNSLRLTWKLVVFVIGFLGVLSCGTYFIWQRQMRLESGQ